MPGIGSGASGRPATAPRRARPHGGRRPTPNRSGTSFAIPSQLMMGKMEGTRPGASRDAADTERRRASGMETDGHCSERREAGTSRGSSACAGPGSTTSRTSTSTSRATPWSSSRASPARASRRWRSAPSTREAQRRYLESVSPYARRLFHQLGVPEVDEIDGLPPAVALQQQRGSPSTRSSVGSVTTLSNLLRMLYSRAGDYPPGQPLLYAESFSPNTPEGACPECHGLGRVYDGDRAVDGAGRLADDPRAGRRRLADRLAWAEPARDPDDARLRRRPPLAGPAAEGPRLDPLHRRAADRAGLLGLHGRTRCGGRSSGRRSRATRGRSPAPGGTCCTPSPTRRAR